MIVAANWKMNLSLGEAGALVAAYVADATEVSADGTTGPQRVLFAPFPYLVPVGMRLSASNIRLGAQDCHPKVSGAHTGDVAAGMIADCGASIVLVGHSERRTDHHESDAMVAQKAEAALAAGLDVMICVGETAAERESGSAIAVIQRQLAGSIPDDCPTDRLTIAYEPVWAIGTGAVASAVEIAEMHAEIRSVLDAKGLSKTGILYGGSVKAENAADIFGLPHVDGALVGGASLDAGQFAAICAAATGK